MLQIQKIAENMKQSSRKNEKDKELEKHTSRKLHHIFETQKSIITLPIVVYLIIQPQKALGEWGNPQLTLKALLQTWSCIDASSLERNSNHLSMIWAGKLFQSRARTFSVLQAFMSQSCNHRVRVAIDNTQMNVAVFQ